MGFNTERRCFTGGGRCDINYLCSSYVFLKEVDRYLVNHARKPLFLICLYFFFGSRLSFSGVYFGKILCRSM